MQRIFITTGIILLVIGLAWPILQGLLPVGRLPGDIVIERPGFRIYLPLTSMLLVSALLSLLLWVLHK